MSCTHEETKDNGGQELHILRAMCSIWGNVGTSFRYSQLRAILKAKTHLRQ